MTLRSPRFSISARSEPKQSNIPWSPLSDPLHLDVQTDAAVNGREPRGSEENWRTAGAGISGWAIWELCGIGGLIWAKNIPTRGRINICQNQKHN